MDPLADKYPGLSPYNYCLNSPLKFIDPKGLDIWEKIKNLVSGQGFRDDNIQENYQQKDWKNLTPQLAKEQGVNKDVNVSYDESDEKPHHYSYLQSDGKTKAIVMTKGGYEKLDESNIENMRSSMDHEKTHTQSPPTKFDEINDPVKVAKWELEVIGKQKEDPTYQKTSSSYKQKVEIYEEYNKSIIRSQIFK
mgnify:CR=1 FL=1